MTALTTPPPKAVRRRGDRVFAGLSTGAGIAILVVLAGVAAFLVAQSIPALTAPRAEIGDGIGLARYVGPLVFGTILAAVLALAVAVPLSLGIALFISHYSPRRLAQGIGYLVDLLAAVPSVVYGLWGALFLAPHLLPLYDWLATHLSWIPLFASASPTGKTILTAALVLAVMILPIVTAITREIFLQAPRLQEEAALALGATRWEMVRMAVLPHARSGIVSASMLGLGRALGETLAVALVLSTSGGILTANLIGSTNPSTIAANIALNFGEATGLTTNTLVFTGLVLFLITFVVNFAARAIVNRRKDFSGVNA